METAAELAQAVTETIVRTVVLGEPRPVLAVDIADTDDVVPAGAGDLALAVGFADPEQVVDLVRRSSRLSGLVVRAAWADSTAIVSACQEAGVTLLALAEGVTWSAAADRLRARIEAQASDPEGAVARDDLFALADFVAQILDAPVTVEDASSQVLAYSSGQDDVDPARTASIFGRRVPRQVRDHYRSTGVFRRLASHTEPFFVPGHGDEVRGRLIVPVHAGGEWLGSVWAVADEDRGQGAKPELRAAVELIALHLLKLRSRGELARQLHLDRLRSLLQGIQVNQEVVEQALPARVAVLRGPGEDLEPSSRREIWTSLARRSGWRQPLVVDLDGQVYAVLSQDQTRPGGWAWLSRLVLQESDRRPGIGVRAGQAVAHRDELARSREVADEVDRIAQDAEVVQSIDDRWAEVVLARALRGLAGTPPVSPLERLLHEAGDRRQFSATLAAVIDHWGDWRAAAKTLGVHPNTVRYRMAGFPDWLHRDLADPTRRTALRLELMLGD